MPRKHRRKIYQLKVTLSGITPPIWRRIQDECRWPEGDSGRCTKKMGTDSGGQSGFAICKAAGRSEGDQEGGKQAQEDGQGSVSAFTR